MDTSEGAVAIDRQYWLEQASTEVTEETHLYIDGQLLRLEAGEQRLQTIRSWIEALFPPAITQRFLIDGEQLGTLDVKHLGQHMKEGLDDARSRNASPALSTTQRRETENDCRSCTCRRARIAGNVA